MARRTRLDFSWSDEKHYRMAQGINRFMDVMDRQEERERQRNEKYWQEQERREARSTSGKPTESLEKTKSNSL